MTRATSPLLVELLLAAATLAVLISAFAGGLLNSQADEVVLAWTAKQALLGQTPYVDYFCFYPPLSVYGLKLFLGLFGTSLGALRLLTVAWLVGATLLVFWILLREQVPLWWSAALAFQLPALIVPFWPISNHHWFAMGLGLAALCTVAGPSAAEGRLRWMGAGLLVCLAGLCLQTDGFLFTVLVLLRLPFGGGIRRTLRASAWFLLGVLIPLSVSVLFLWNRGALGAAWQCLVAWPSRYYKQPGGFNDVSPLPMILEALRARAPSSFWDPDTLGLATFLLALALPVAALLSLAFSPAWVLPGRPPAWTYPRHLLSFFAVLGFYLSGRADWVHLLVYLPLFLLIPAAEIDWKNEPLRPIAAKALLGLLTAWAMVRWPVHWVNDPPLVHRVLQADAQFARQGPVGVLAALPDVRREKLPIVYLPYGSSLYFFWAPDPPPVDWIMAPSLKHDSPEQFERLARFLDRHAVPYVLIKEDQVEGFLNDPSPISDVLARAYRPERKTPWGTLFKRVIPGAPAATPPGGAP